MFKSHKKPRNPTDYIPFKPRLGAILQLCLGFTAILWIAGYPFLGEVYLYKEFKLLYEQVADSPLLTTDNNLSIREAFSSLQAKVQLPFLDRAIDGLRLLLVGISPYETAWIILSIILPIMLLKKVDGARNLIWILPALTVLYSFEALNFPESQIPKLYPSEKELLILLNQNKESSVDGQREQLVKGWETYLASLSENGDPQEGLAHFNIALLEAKATEKITPFKERPSPFLLLLYIGWNLLFAYWAYRYPANIYTAAPAK